MVFPESPMNLLGYARLQAGDTRDAIQLFKLNTEAYPASANEQDSLSDGYEAAGRTISRWLRSRSAWNCCLPTRATPRSRLNLSSMPKKKSPN
jgi:hypothetical protein